MEEDPEIHEGSYTAMFWQYDSRLGRRWNLDPKPNPSISQYATFANNPIWYSDPLGDTIVISFHPEGNSVAIDKANSRLVKEQVNDGVFILTAHGSPRVIQDDNNHSRQYDNPHEIIDNLKNNENFADAMESGEEITLILKSCNTGACPVDFYGEEWTDETQSIGQKISKEYPNITVIAPDGSVINGKVVDDSEGVMKSRKKGEYGIKRLEKKNGTTGKWNVFKEGEKTGEINYEIGQSDETEQTERDTDNSNKSPIKSFKKLKKEK